jgi:hypothetical protein
MFIHKIHIIYICTYTYIHIHTYNCKYIYERVSKYVTNGSKTAVIDVIGFLCVSLGNNTVKTAP